MAAQQVDLFLDSMMGQTLRGDRALMEFPFFSLAKRPRHTPITYDDGRVMIRVSPGERGIATIWDKDILIYVTSLMNEQLERGIEPGRTIQFAAVDFLRVAGRGTSGKSYEQLKDALFRLRSTTITTSIASAGEEEERGFGWIEAWRIVKRMRKDGNRVMEAIEVTLSDWMYRAIVKERRVLAMDSKYFELTMAMERRLYELVRKHLGNQQTWMISLPRLAEKIGTQMELKKLKAELVEICRRDSLIHYQMNLEAPPGIVRVPPRRVQVVFSHRDRV
ncbi:replication initiator protein A [Gluconacetobacter entanii]|uniref:Replication initiator protein A n=1 Tax=Gluconacetobacter entanii TaxID=108528 RepID=A0ABT3K2J2_9PROT|nr:MULTISPECIES: replication initiator protein A [Acetobacteraceae]MCW4589601.1 replication initiator protein A [Gluconacetobacter entanii]NPC89193.1 replication initiator protein A [Gluconacetobacter entanii]GBQ62848.1 plasmid replication initiator [Novacetimonas hansenii NRIC 0243]